MTMKDGSQYTGEWIDDNIEGEGEYIWTDGKSYSG